MTQIIQIELNSLSHRIQIITAAVTIDLSPSRNAGLNLMSQHVTRNQLAILLVHGDCVWARPYDAQTALENVQELGQLA
jgi:hypothetical protein